MNDMELKKSTLQELMGLMDDHMFSGVRRKGQPVAAEMEVSVEAAPTAEPPASIAEDELDPDAAQQLMDLYKDDEDEPANMPADVNSTY